MKTLSVRLEGVIIADREAPNAAYLAHPECAGEAIAEVNENLGYERLYLYGPCVLDTPCARCGA